MKLSGTFEGFLPENKDWVLRPILGLTPGAMCLCLKSSQWKVS